MAGDSAAGRDWILLLVAAGLLYNAVEGMVTGSAILFFRTVKRPEDGYLYWWAVLMSSILGVAALVAFLL